MFYIWYFPNFFRKQLKLEFEKKMLHTVLKNTRCVIHDHIKNIMFAFRLNFTTNFWRKNIGSIRNLSGDSHRLRGNILFKFDVCLLTYSVIFCVLTSGKTFTHRHESIRIWVIMASGAFKPTLWQVRTMAFYLTKLYSFCSVRFDNQTDLYCWMWIPVMSSQWWNY